MRRGLSDPTPQRERVDEGLHVSISSPQQSSQSLPADEREREELARQFATMRLAPGAAFREGRTQSMVMPSALTALQMGITDFDSSCAGLGGCPFAGHKGAAGNICTEDLVFMAHEMGIETGIDLDALIECARMIEAIVGHPLPGKIMHGGSLTKYRQPALAGAAA